jgi:hypothetical protein
MAAAAASNITPDEISSRLISHVDFIARVYDIVKYAAKIATEDREVKENQNKLCVLPAEIPGITRKSKCKNITSRSSSIIYNSDNITLSGGAVLNIYNSLLSSGFKERRGIKELKDYITRDTLDIDMKWWPQQTGHISNSRKRNYVITSKSLAIEKLVDKFEDALNGVFNNISTKGILVDLINKYSGLSIVKLNTIISKKEVHYFGAHSINITFDIEDTTGNTYSLKIGDISIYDTASSQDYTMEGKYINELNHMTADPNYVSPLSGYSNTIKKINIGDIIIGVPSIDRYILQQMFAFNNQIREFNQKALINYRRVLFIKEILEKYISPKNNANFKNIINASVGKTQEYLLAYILYTLNQSTRLYSGHIASICKTIPIPESDILLKDICSLKYLPVVELAENTSSKGVLVPKHLLVSKNTGNSIPVFSSPEEARMYAAKMYPTTGSGLKKRTHRQKNKTRKHKTLKHSKK